VTEALRALANVIDTSRASENVEAVA
jgi:hypothetical protein